MPRSWYVPTPRAVALYRVVAAYGVVTMRHVIATTFAECRSRTQAYVCVQRSIRAGYLRIAGHLPPVDGVGSGARCLILGPRGRQLLGDLDGVPVGAMKRPTREATAFSLAHSAAISDVRLALETAAAAEPLLALAGWRRDDELAKEPIVVTLPLAAGATLAVVPDARAVVKVGDAGRRQLLLEVDRGTVSMKRLAVKCRAYLALLAQNPRYTLLLVTSTPQRLRHIADAIADESRTTNLPADDMLLTVQELVRPETVLRDPIFSAAGGAAPVSLLGYLTAASG